MALLLVALWSVYALLGSSNACRVVQARAVHAAYAPETPKARASAAAAPVCHCLMCRMAAKRGGKCCCCCHHAAPPRGLSALQNRCDRGLPSVAAAVTSWPVIVPHTQTAASAPPQPTLSAPSLCANVLSACLPIPTRPPLAL